MGSELLTEEAPPSYTEQFYDAFPYYLSIGMTAREYWQGNSMLTKYYRKAHKMRLEHENYNAWLQGAYVYDAMCGVSPILHAFAKKGTKPVPYLKEPYGVQKAIDPAVVKENFLAKWKSNKARWKERAQQSVAKIEGGGINADN